MSWNAIVDLCRRRKWPECIKTWKQKITGSRFRGNISYRFVIIIYHPSASQRIRFISISHPSWKAIPMDENAVRLTRQPSFSLLTAVSREQGKRAKNSLETKSWPIRLANVATFQRILNRWDWWNRRDGNNEWRVTCIGTEQSFETTWNIVSQYRVDFSGKTGNAGKINFTFYYTATRSRCKNNLSRMESRARARLFSIVVSSSNEPELYRKEQALISDPDLEQRYMNLFRYDIENRRSISRRVLYKFDPRRIFLLVAKFQWQTSRVDR